MKIKRCDFCGSYTLKDICPKCGKPTKNPRPPSFSPEDKYGRYRRLAKLKPDLSQNQTSKSKQTE